MRIIRDISENEVVLAFLQAEIDAPRYKDLVRPFIDPELVRNPDLSDSTANLWRSFALGQYRGWRKNGALFAGFPSDVRWKLVQATIADLADFRYAREPSWVALSRGSLLVSDGAANAERTPPDETKLRILAVEQNIRQGASFPPIVALAEGEDQVHVLLEGHTRASAFVRALDPGDVCQLIVGYVSSLSGWRWY